jgi:hypothetical protein
MPAWVEGADRMLATEAVTRTSRASARLVEAEPSVMSSERPPATIPRMDKLHPLTAGTANLITVAVLASSVEAKFGPRR